MNFVEKKSIEIMQGCTLKRITLCQIKFDLLFKISNHHSCVFISRQCMFIIIVTIVLILLFLLLLLLSRLFFDLIIIVAIDKSSRSISTCGNQIIVYMSLILYTNIIKQLSFLFY